MCKHGGTHSPQDKYVTLAANSPPGAARGRFVGGHQSGVGGCKLPPFFNRGASSCASQGRRQGEPWGASPRPSAPTYLPLLPCGQPRWFCKVCWCLACVLPKALLPEGNGRDIYARVQVNGQGGVCCVRAVCKCVVA